MLPEDVPQAAVDAAAVEIGRALSPFYDRPTTWDALITRRVVAAAAPHLIDDAMIERAAEAYASYTYGDEPGRIDRGAALRILRAALGEVGTDGR